MGGFARVGPWARVKQFRQHTHNHHGIKSWGRASIYSHCSGQLFLSDACQETQSVELILGCCIFSPPPGCTVHLMFPGRAVARCAHSGVRLDASRERADMCVIKLNLAPAGVRLNDHSARSPPPSAHMCASSAGAARPPRARLDARLARASASPFDMIKLT